MKIQKLKIENFKGIKTQEIDFDGENVAIYGENEVGKTTIADAIHWVLFDKDSLGAQKFDIKPLNENKKPKTGVEPTVELELDDIKLKKVYTEKWTKQRGQAKKVMTGHTTAYFVDNFPVKEKDYKAKIESICNEDKFKLLTNPKYFNEKLHWTKRRELLFEIIGDDKTNQEIQEKSNKKKVLESQKKNINKEIEKIPVRIDEANKSLQETQSQKVVEDKLTTLREEKNKIQEEIKIIESGGNVDLLKKDLLKIENEIQEIEHENKLQNQNIAREKEEKIYKRKRQFKNLIDKKDSRKIILENLNKSKETQEKAIEGLRNEWSFNNELIFLESEIEDICSFCGEPIPQTKLAEIREKTKSEFNLEKSQKLEDITIRGKKAAEALKDIENEITNIQKEISGLCCEISELEKDIKRIEGQYKDVPLPYNHKELLLVKTEIESNINSQTIQVPEEITNKLEETNEQIDALKQELLVIENNQKTEQRIKELKAEERKLAQEYEHAENELFEIENFIQEKVSELSEKINSKFGLAEFRLFETQINGGINEVCETTVGGVSYNSLNSAMRIQVGLDIIKTLQKHLNISMFIIVDNQESITKPLPKMECQIISLFAVPGQKTLKIERN